MSLEKELKEFLNSFHGTKLIRPDYTTNSKSYYDYLEKVTAVLMFMSKKIDEYDGVLTSELQKLKNTLDEYLEQWDKNLEKFDESVLVLLQKWMDDGTFEHIINHEIFQNKLDTSIFEQFELSVNQQLQQIVNGQPLKPEMFEGTDLQRLQQMFDLAISQQRPMELSKHYDITGGSIIVKKGQIPRIPLRVFGGGKITKLDEGYFFTSNFTQSGDLTFEGIFFEGNFNNAVFDENDNKLIRIKTEGCFFYRINTVHKSNTYLQSISSDGDTVIGGNGAVFDFDGCYDVKINSILVEEHTGQLIKHRGQGTAHTEAISLSVSSSTLEGFKGTLPVIQLRNTFGFLLNGNYFESNLGGHVVFDEASIQRGVTITNNTHEGRKDVDALIVMGGNAHSVITSNNVAKNIAILDTRKTVGGFVQSTNDKRSYGSPTHFIDDPLRLYIYDTEINRMQNGVNLENQLSNSTFGTLEDWEGVNVDITNPIYQNGNILNVKSKGTVNNAFARHKLKNGVASGDRFILMLDSKSSALDPFQVFIVNVANGSTLGAATLTPTKINEMEHFIVDVPITISSDTAHISLYPKLYNTSISGERDFYKVALYKTNKAYPLTSFDKYVGYSTHSTGMGVHKLDANGDGVADIPNGLKRPVLSAENVGYPFLDRTLGDKLIIWNGSQWKDTMGEIV